MNPGRGRSAAVLGAGVMGACAALFLARRGWRVALYDQAEAPLVGASRWNEGKIHLGFLYSADPTLASARQLLAGAMRFKPLIERLIGETIDTAIVSQGDVYLRHRDSVVSAQAMSGYFEAVSRLAAEHPDAGCYFGPIGAARQLSRAELATVTDAPEIGSGFATPERSVSTNWIADRLVGALASEDRVELRLGTRVTAARPVCAEDPDGRWRVASADGAADDFDAVVNALWAGRLAVDSAAGLPPPARWSHRYRLALFIRTAKPVAAPSVVVATGPFGDLKAYGPRDFYLSWYPAGLRVESAALAPAEPPRLDASAEATLADAMVKGLAALAPAAAEVRAAAERIEVRGGWVYAAGDGPLSDPAATLHRRADFGVTRLGSYVSVDTGKYASAPHLAERLAALLNDDDPATTRPRPRRR